MRQYIWKVWTKLDFQTTDLLLKVPAHKLNMGTLITLHEKRKKRQTKKKVTPTQSQ